MLISEHQIKALTFSPTSGFHHARPEGGSGFCTFSGQVIASLKIYEEKKLVGAYLDLDGHYGNSIEDSRKLFPLLLLQEKNEADSAIKINLNIELPSSIAVRYFNIILKINSLPFKLFSDC